MDGEASAKTEASRGGGSNIQETAMIGTHTKPDSQIKSDVLSELKWDTAVDETEVGVQVKNGVVTLTGTIGALAKKLAAIDAAHRVFGVLDVVDDMKVSVPSFWERTDQDIAAAVRHALEWDVTVPDEQIKSTVKGGVVTLEGTVQTWSARQSAEIAVQRLMGVRNVVNRISIPTVTVSAFAIKNDIEEALERQTAREARRLDVSVHDGTVTISGAVRSWGEKNAVERVAWATPGVRRLEDRTTVDPYQ
jgi:osmotically-inducible protein OsmY